MVQTYWGVDSAQAVNEQLYNCVVQNYGKPAYWGRYMRTIPGVNDGLTPQEIQFLRQRGIKILPIYNNFRGAIGYNQGQLIARQAIARARVLQIPQGVTIFANIEKWFRADAAWLRGWVDAFFPSVYTPGFYANPRQGPFNFAYCTAAAGNPRVRQQAIIWSSEPRTGASRRGDAPAFNPAKPTCAANVYGWQYGESAPLCPIDTNLITEDLYRKLWV
ncbi:glycoside hydrolase domain-containing protein [Brevibacillus dissolubilis]|uniref:glycoside hydrolase domain-containing protein n=1 Tax=Brevibacillus dissolubilis TaxID=1844116 RepID=UPI001115FF66|nr:glycoside hydrolase domain-containing protein [Brevibacillus dissolubilis]